MTEQPAGTIDEYNDIYWRLPNGKLHREDGPAIVRSNGSKQWWFRGDLHRIDGPAIVWDDGTKEWWVNGKFIYWES